MEFSLSPQFLSSAPKQNFRIHRAAFPFPLLRPSYQQNNHARILEASKICPQNASVKKTIYSRQNESLCQMLVAMRKMAGLTQRQLADKLERERSFIARLELGERRLDVVEFFWICKACGINPESSGRQLMRKLQEIQSNDKI